MNKSLKFKPKQLRNISPLPDAINQLKKNGIYIILDNIMDTYNIGGIFRLADAVSAKKIYLCGITATPPNTKIKKASVNTWQSIKTRSADNKNYCRGARSEKYFFYQRKISIASRPSSRTRN